MNNTYKGFSISQIVTVKELIKCQYYDYPNKGDNNKILEPGELAVIDSINPKVRINKPNTGEYFYNLIRLASKDQSIYPVMDYHNLVKLNS
jgi:hypothetical protein